MKTSILNRLKVLEEQYKDDPLIVLAITETGEEVKMTMRECLENKNVSFKKVISGKSLKDIELLLKAQKEEAERAMLEGGGIVETTEEEFFKGWENADI